MKLEQAGFKCENCGSYSDPNVHHITYVRLGHERLEDLKVLCQVCHSRWHFADLLTPILSEIKKYARHINRNK